MKPAKFTAEEQAAFRAFDKGSASEHQQKVAWEYLLFVLCGIRDPSFQADHSATNFNEGRKYPAYQIISMIHPATATPAD